MPATVLKYVQSMPPPLSEIEVNLFCFFVSVTLFYCSLMILSEVDWFVDIVFIGVENLCFALITGSF